MTTSRCVHKARRAPIPPGPARPTASGAAGQAGAPRDGDRLRNSCILVVEDEFFSALQLESILGHVGCTIVGPISTLADALDAARDEVVDAALLDVSISGELVYPVADALSERGVPVVFVTGHSGADLPQRFRGFPRVGKPYNARELVSLLREVV